MDGCRLEGNILSWPSSDSVGLLARYLAAGGLNSLLGFAAIMLCMGPFAMPPLAANAAGYAAGYVLSFLMHRHFTFRSKVGLGYGLAAYLPVVAIGYAANAVVLLASIKMAGLNPYVAQLLAIGTYVAVTFVGSSKFVFRRIR